MDDLGELALTIFGIAAAFFLGVLVLAFIVEFWVYILAFIVIAGIIYFSVDYYLKNNTKEIERLKKIAESRELRKVAREEKAHNFLVEEQKMDKKLSEINDFFNTNLEREYNPNFVGYLLGYSLDKFPLQALSRSVYQQTYNQEDAKILTDYFNVILSSVYEEWFKGFYPLKTYRQIEEEAKEYANGRNEKLSILELYTSYIVKEMLLMITITKNLQEEMATSIEKIICKGALPAFKYMERKVLILNGGNYGEQVLDSKVVFLLMSVLFKNREGLSIQGREPERKKKNEDIETLKDNIEEVKAEVLKNENFYEYIQKARKGSSELIKFVEIEIANLDPGDSDFLEQANAIIERIEEETG